MVGCPRAPVRLLRRRPRPYLANAPSARRASRSPLGAVVIVVLGVVVARAGLAEVDDRVPHAGHDARPGEVGLGCDDRRARRAPGRDRDRDGRFPRGSQAAPGRSPPSRRVLGASLVILTAYVAVKGTYQAAMFEERVEERNLLYIDAAADDRARALRRHPADSRSGRSRSAAALTAWSIRRAAAQPRRTRRAMHPGSRSSRAGTTTTSWASLVRTRSSTG